MAYLVEETTFAMRIQCQKFGNPSQKTIFL